jgi:hypothetical protein
MSSSQLDILNNPIGNEYNNLQQSNPIMYQYTNNSALEDIAKAINENLAQLNWIQNEIDIVGNLQKETLFKKEQLLTMENEDLLKQLRELEIIQNNIANKDKIIHQTNMSIEKDVFHSRILIVGIILALILFTIVYLYGSGIISKSLFIKLLIIILVIYVFMFIYINNIFYLRDALNYVFTKDIQLAKKITKWAKIEIDDLKTDIYKDEQEWIKNNCGCPIEEEIQEETLYPGGVNIIQPRIPGYFYYDGTAPQQLLVPTPNPKLNLSDKIDWVDYSPDGQIYYDSKLNKNISINNKYYNYKDKNDPKNILTNALDKARIFVDDETRSANF